jgi:hypothetical protein
MAAIGAANDKAIDKEEEDADQPRSIDEYRPPLVTAVACVYRKPNPS